MDALRGQPTDKSYAAATAAIDRLAAADPQSLAAPLERAFAAMLPAAVNGAGQSSDERVRVCLQAVEEVLKK